MRFALALALAGCATEAQLPVDASAPPVPMTLWVSSVSHGQAMQVVVRGADPNDRVWIGASLAGTGAGPCPASLGGQCLDIRGPTLIGAINTDASGNGQLRLTVPSTLPAGDVWFQAAVGNGAASHVSNVVERPVYTQPVLPIEFCDASQLPDDPVFLNSLSVSGSLMDIDIGYSGGCADHDFRVCWDGIALTSFPQQIGLDLSHDANGDLCEAFFDVTMQVDLSSIVGTTPTVVSMLGDSVTYTP
jgi:hypothetical protein